MSDIAEIAALRSRVAILEAEGSKAVEVVAEKLARVAELAESAKKAEAKLARLAAVIRHCWITDSCKGCELSRGQTCSPENTVAWLDDVLKGGA